MAIAEIHVVLKPTLLDAQGATVLKALHQLGHTQVNNVRIGKYITLEVDDAQVGPALEQQLNTMCQHLLANPVIEDYEITVGTSTAGGLTTGAVVEPTLPVTQPLDSVATTAPTINTMTPTGLSAVGTAPPSALAPSEQLAVGEISASTVGTPDPFAMDYDTYMGLATQERLAIQQLAWQKHGAWIRQQLADLRAGWILCVGGQVLESGATLNTLPSDAHRDQIGRSRDLVPWIFTQPTAT